MPWRGSNRWQADPPQSSRSAVLERWLAEKLVQERGEHIPIPGGKEIGDTGVFVPTVDGEEIQGRAYSLHAARMLARNKINDDGRE